MSKYLFLLFFCAGTLSTAHAQTKTVFFYNKHDIQVMERDSADYFRIVEAPESDSTLFIIKDFFVDGSIKRVGNSMRLEPPMFDGQVLSYYQKGKRKRLSQYVQGKLTGDSFCFYPNGKLHTILSYSGDKTTAESPYLVTELKDSLGNDLVVNSQGTAVFYDDDYLRVTDEGEIKDGLKEGVWTGYRVNEKLSYTEKYLKGRFLSGESIDENGVKYHYTKQFQDPSFKGGMEKFYLYLKRSIRYPPQAFRSKATGIAKVSFIVTRTGELADVKVTNKIDSDLANEAIRVIKETKGWIPATIYGKPVDILYTMPFEFFFK